jgi:hypothetical protein
MEKQIGIKIERKTAFYFKSNNKGAKLSTDPTLTLLTIITDGTRLFNSLDAVLQQPINQQ